MVARFRPSYWEIKEPFRPIFKGLSFEWLWSGVELRPFKIKKNRGIFTFDRAGRTFFVKRYHGRGAGLLRYSLGSFRQRYGPENEWHKANLLKKLGIKAAEPVAFGIERRYGTVRRALVVMLKMEGTRLEDLLREERDLQEKRVLVEKLGAFAGRFHSLGFSHQDFYLCHLFYVPESEEIGLIDLQRIRYHLGPDAEPRLGWIVKDLAQLDYSARNVLGGDQYPELVRSFVSAYRQYLPLIGEPGVARKIRKKVERIARHDRKLQMRAGARGR